eukprot:TRINITY_DN23734_c0_g1_i3.p4 TRINITY_DN23734_c0_g1~~TRINITY_DN23734_c0_g1_i3.p4  ORF type:complete len:117 (+),score=14.26 TRINITY_DN23734_c0_g1_i3:230-580(+)
MQVTRICGFLLLGYREQRWHWEESIVMMCKLGIVFIAVFIKDAVLQADVGMWMMTFALVQRDSAHPEPEPAVRLRAHPPLQHSPDCGDCAGQLRGDDHLPLLHAQGVLDEDHDLPR